MTEAGCRKIDNLQLLTVSKNGLEVFSVDDRLPPDQPLAPSKCWSDVRIAQYSANGTLIGFAQANGSADDLVVIDAETAQELYRCNSGGEIKKLYFSPKASFLVTLCKLPDPTAKNVVLFDVRRIAEGEVSQIETLNLKLSSPNWPLFRWTEWETICCKMVTNGVLVFDGQNPVADSRDPAQIVEEGISCTALSPEMATGTVNIAVFTPARKNEAACIKIYKSDQLNKPTCRKSLFQAENCSLKWNKRGDALLVITSTDVDITGKSYYGNTFAHFMKADGSYSAQLTTADSGAVHDVQWNPCERVNNFCMIRGPMPSEVLFCEGEKGEPVTTLGKIRRNTLRWDPFGRLIYFGGFGNLPGDITVWDYQLKAKLGATNARCTVECEWAPDGRHLFAATTSPRLRVDNCVKIYRYTGKCLSKKDFDELTFVAWRPSPSGTFKVRDPSPDAKEEYAAAQQLLKTSTAVGAYRPSGSSGVLAEKLRNERNAEEIFASRPYVPRSKIDTTTIPGLAPVSPAPKAGKKKKSKQKPSFGSNAPIEPREQPAFVPPSSQPAFVPPSSQTFESQPIETEEAQPSEEMKGTLDEQRERHTKQIAQLNRKLTEIKALKARKGPYNRQESEKLKKEKLIISDIQNHTTNLEKLNVQP